MDHDDGHPTCARTYATLRLYPGALHPDRVTERLGIAPSETQTVNAAGRALHGWFLTSDGAVVSRDVRRHVDWLLDRIENAKSELDALLREGVRPDVCCYWLSAAGHGGPTLSPSHMLRLGALGLECWFDVYFAR